MRALISVYDKSGLVPFAQALNEMGWEIISSGGTSKALQDAGVPCCEVESVTGAPEMLNGRVKTLHPSIHGGILADRDKPEHMSAIAEHEIVPIDLVVCNLYPFTSDPSIDLIDIGGPSMVRSAAKNHAHVGVVVSPHDYDLVITELRANGTLTSATKKRLARDAFAHTSQYDAAILQWLDEGMQPSEDDSSLPTHLTLQLEKAETLRYGENPHQEGARYREVGKTSWWDSMQQHSGIALSFLNLFDADAAWNLVHKLGDQPAAVIVKHANPCGAAVARSLQDAYTEAFACDPVSAFGGIIALNRVVDASLAKEMTSNPKADVLIAPGYSKEALELFATKRKNLRVLEAPSPGERGLELRRIDGGFLAQQADPVSVDRSLWKVVTKTQPTEEQWKDIELSWVVCAAVSSNAIVITKDGKAIGIGAGQQNRLDSAAIAVRKAGDAAQGAVCASDAFFPFRDGLDALAEAGVTTIVQPGGSIRDDEVIAAADEHRIAMVFTATRHFRH